MKRTANRPLPGGRMRRSDARDFGVFLSGVSVVLMGIAIAIALAREWRGSLIAPMVMHGINNGLAMTALLVLLYA